MLHAWLLRRPSCSFHPWSKQTLSSGLRRGSSFYLFREALHRLRKANVHVAQLKPDICLTCAIESASLGDRTDRCYACLKQGLGCQCTRHSACDQSIFNFDNGCTNARCRGGRCNSAPDTTDRPSGQLDDSEFCECEDCRGICFAGQQCGRSLGDSGGIVLHREANSSAVDDAAQLQSAIEPAGHESRQELDGGHDTPLGGTTSDMCGAVSARIQSLQTKQHPAIIGSGSAAGAVHQSWKASTDMCGATSARHYARTSRNTRPSSLELDPPRPQYISRGKPVPT